MKLSNNFTLSEFTESQTALRLGINNKPGAIQMANMEMLCIKILQPIREALNFPIHITSGYRSISLNIAIGGSATSQHCKGIAADFVCKNMATAFALIRDTCNFDQLIWEFGDDEQPRWIHVSYNPDGKNRKEVLKAYKVNGLTKYDRL